MKIMFLIPPSEWKNKLWWEAWESLSYLFEKPIDIIQSARPGDLNCKWDRYAQACILNMQNIQADSSYTQAIHRYSWVMYKAIDYPAMSAASQLFFEENFYIISGMYGLVTPKDIIGNYKLPITSKWLYAYWWSRITQTIADLKPDRVMNLLPQAYAKAISFEELGCEVVHVNFMKYQGDELIKMAHGVKKTKWAWIKNICEQQVIDPEQFWGSITHSNHIHTLTIIEP